MNELPFLRSAIFLVVFISGCSILRTSQHQKTEVAGSYHRQIDPFPVFDEKGKQIPHPFFGGLNAPRPQFADIDGDGDPDLFVQERTDELIFFEHQSKEADKPLTWKTDKYQDLNIGEWSRFIDMDQDGDLDLLTEQPYSYIRYYRNEGTSQKANFKLAADSLRDIHGSPIFSDRQNIPNVTDIDCDGKLDLFIGSLDGTLARFESQGLDENDIPQFELLTKRFEDIEIVKQFEATLHGANTMAFMDIDEDGDQDLFWGDFFEPGILMIENEGTCSIPDLEGEPRAFPFDDPAQTSGYNVPALTDWEQDGDADLFLGVLGGAYNASLTASENFYFYRQEEGKFSLASKQFLGMMDVGDESIPAAGDLDGDGDLDLLLANKIDPVRSGTSLIYRFENKGTNRDPEFHLTGTLNLPEAYHYAPALADLNGDGLTDLLIGNWKGSVAYYINTGNGFESVNPNIVELERGSNAVPELGDIDGDGDLDLLLGSSGGTVSLFVNRGTKEIPDFQLSKEALSGVETKHRSAPALNDIDGDGDLDLVLGSKIEGYLFFRNTGTEESPNFNQEELPFSIDLSIQFGAPRFADLDGDGVAEFLSGTRTGGVLYYSR